MSRIIGRTEARGSVSTIARLDLNQLEPAQRCPALANLIDELDLGSTVEIVIADLPDAGKPEDSAARSLSQLVDAGVHVRLVGPPADLHRWLLALGQP
ncbi:MAG TPA: hypothetical protein VGE38_08645 [Nocardioides sp.]|uniref:hypothetical protein n=1 Tax=Nocardioides sp. TaxID=35761 RepID=UPI002ED776B3